MYIRADLSLYAIKEQIINCRVMLGGEIYYRAIGRPWGPAADFIVELADGPSRPAH